MTDMRPAIEPKSTQLNADDLISGPRTVTITTVSVRPGVEQPVSISFEGDNNKPYFPCKSMARVLVAMWGPDAKEYTGRSLTLYRDPKVRWAGLEVGGIRISHMSHIERDHVMALTETRSSRKPFTVKPLRAQPTAKQQTAPSPSAPPTPPAEPSLAEQLDHLEPDEWKQAQGRVEDDRQAEMLPDATATARDLYSRVTRENSLAGLVELDNEARKLKGEVPDDVYDKLVAHLQARVETVRAS